MVAELDKGLLRSLGSELRRLMEPLRSAQSGTETDCAMPLPPRLVRPTPAPKRATPAGLENVGIASAVAAEVGDAVASITLALLGRAGAFERDEGPDAALPF